jgi:glutathione synthase
MKFGFVVNSMENEHANYATTVLAHGACGRNHDVRYITVEDFIHQPDGRLQVKTRSAAGELGPDRAAYLEHLQSEDAKVESLDVTDFDVLLLRNDPAEDARERPWAQAAGIVFGQEAVRQGVLVLNDPTGLSKALNKFYFQRFPDAVRPKTLICRNADEIKAFIEQHSGKVILKPLQGSGGQSVFLVREDEEANINQMIEAVSRDGYVVVQEFLPAAEVGDVRLFLMNGRPLVVDGHYAALQRLRGDDDLRSNMSVGGQVEKAEVAEEALKLAAAVGPLLVEDGMFFVGLDVAGDKLLEINLFSPGGLNAAGKLEGVDFAPAVLEAIERKVEAIKRDPARFDNRRLACADLSP